MSDDRHSGMDANRRLAEKVERFRSDLESALRDLASPIETAAPAGASEFAGAVQAIHAILDAGSADQREVLRSVLDASALCFTRCLILIGRDSLLVEWEARGFGGNGRAHERLSLPATGDHLMSRARTSGTLRTAGPEGPGSAVVEALGGSVPVASAACPLLVRGRPVAILYGDSAETAAPPTSADLFAVFARLGGAALEMQALTRRSHPAGETAAGSRLPARAPMRVGPAGTPPAAPEEAEMQALLGDLDSLPRRESAEPALSPEEQRQHNDARRFASLLVSELLLYNEEAVIQGRKQRDLSHRLAREIERTRQAYAARVPTGLRTAPRYLEDELLRVLADGDEALLSR
ncbi:MAG TPA: hypothetical protein VGS03_07905 [Candidatus Polarisedimenticolia bacterium]|nr:hypothetical protein [Candidatus Polarisedimenticolia bacterium]